MTEPTADTRQLHPPCSACGQEDDHPRHVVIYSLTDDSQNKNQHFDCCVNDGGCGSCEPVLAVADGAKGLDLLPHIESVRSAEAEDLNEGVAPVSDFTPNRKG